MTFNEFLKQECGQTWQGIRMDMLIDVFTEDQINDEHSMLVEEYIDYCEEARIIPEMD